MAKPLNWDLVDPPKREGTSRRLRNRLALTTILAVAPFLNYGRPTYAACVASPSPTFICSGTSTGESIFANNADVSTLASPPFVVTSDGVIISGLGDQRFTDNNASTSITNSNYYGRGLSVVSVGDDGLTPGAVTIYTDGTISGTAHGIYARNVGSGDITITANGTVTGVDVDEPGDPDTGPDTFVANDGIHAENFGNNLTITTGVGSAVTGEHNGIDARNYGSGDLTITANGDVTGNEFDAIYARNFGNDLRVAIGAQGVVDGAGNGIQAQNFGAGNLEITVDGDVTGRSYDGIRAYNSGGGDLTVTAGAQSVILGADNGIDARNFYSEDGDGDLTVTADGVVTGYGNDAIYARNYGDDLTINTGAQSIVRGGGNGIGAYNFGGGNLTIMADGLVGGYAEDGDGIHAFNSEDGEDVTIVTGASSDVFGGKDGIDAHNEGSGFLKITADGKVTGYGEDYFGNGVLYGDGIRAYNSANGSYAKIITGANSDVFGAKDGIEARNFGSGFLEITANGKVTGESGDGIYALNVYGEFDRQFPFPEYFGNATDLIITTGTGSNVSGGEDGIDARNFGKGFLEITAKGQVTGQGGDGISAYNSSRGTSLTVTTEAGSVITGVDDDGIDASNRGDGDLTVTANGTVTGLGTYNTFGSGIEVENSGSGGTIIKVGGAGLVQGNFAGIDAYSNNAQDISITNDGLVRNLSAESDALAIQTGGGATHIENNNTLIGFVTLDLDDFYDDVLDNNAFWNTANGTNDFGEGVDEVNNTGTLLAADDQTVHEETTLANLESFNNNSGGLVSLVDGQEGDVLFLRGEAPGVLKYTSDGGRLAVDAVLGPAGESDRLYIDGDVSGTTTVHVNVVGATGANLTGIPVVIVQNGGTTVPGDFVLDGPLNAGFYTWDMRLDGDTHELFTTGVGVGASQFAAGITGGQDIWYQTIGTLLQRQADFRALLEGTQVTPVADFAEPVEPTPTAHITPGFWLRGVGAYLERDDEEGGFNLDRKQTIWGGMAGFDFGTENAGDVWMFGLFGGYLTSKLKFDETNGEWKYDGPTVGAYATYIDKAFYANATVKADFLNIDIDPGDLGTENADTDALMIGGLFDTGYKFGHELFIEPQASLAVVHSEIDDVDVFGGTVQFDDETSVRGRLGVRLGFDQTASDAVVYSGDVIASVWQDFSGGNDVSITDPIFGSFGASDDPGETYGDVSLGFSVAAPDGWSSFIRGNYLFGDGFEAITGNAGVRYAF